MNPIALLPRAAAVLCASAALSACAASHGFAHAPPPAVRLEQASGGTTTESPTAAPAAPATSTASTAGLAAGPGANPSAANAGEAPPATARADQAAPMLIYTANFALRVERERFDEVLDRVLAGAQERGGYLVQRNETSIQVRVPSARFHDAVSAVEGAGEVLRRDISASDVSEEFHDAEVRLQNLRAVRARLEEFLRRAGTMAEALQVERELERVTAEIDRLQGRLRFLSARVAFSLVSVALEPRPVVIAAPRTVEVTPPRRVLNLPVPWLHELGLDRLLNLQSED